MHVYLIPSTQVGIQFIKPTSKKWIRLLTRWPKAMNSSQSQFSFPPAILDRSPNLQSLIDIHRPLFSNNPSKNQAGTSFEPIPKKDKNSTHTWDNHLMENKKCIYNNYDITPSAAESTMSCQQYS